MRDTGDFDSSTGGSARAQAQARVLQLPLPGPVTGSGMPYHRPEDVHPVLRRAGAPPAAVDLLTQAQRGLAEARELQGPLERYALAHLAALRAAAAVLALRGRPEENARKRKRIRSAWEVLPEVAPELSEWALYYAAGAPKRAAAEAGIASAASARDADDLVRNTALFLRMVQRLIARGAVPAAREPHLRGLGGSKGLGDLGELGELGGEEGMPRTG